MNTGIEIRCFYIGNLQVEYRAMRGDEILDADTNHTNLIRRIGKRFGESNATAAGNQQKSGGY